mmetsp:Transcript_4001/g.13992  ORF Transcript_4001/g.13992 Transcript_4001/m.13992 type:complete len:233 (+) Transcript_4001:52-750(+)
MWRLLLLSLLGLSGALSVGSPKALARRGGPVVSRAPPRCGGALAALPLVGPEVARTGASALLALVFCAPIKATVKPFTVFITETRTPLRRAVSVAYVAWALRSAPAAWRFVFALAALQLSTTQLPIKRRLAFIAPTAVAFAAVFRGPTVQALAACTAQARAGAAASAQLVALRMDASIARVAKVADASPWISNTIEISIIVVMFALSRKFSRNVQKWGDEGQAAPDDEQAAP